jgi:hypothetical protein
MLQKFEKISGISLPGTTVEKVIYKKRRGPGVPVINWVGLREKNNISRIYFEHVTTKRGRKMFEMSSGFDALS